MAPSHPPDRRRNGSLDARFHRLLVAVDGSEHAALALAEAIALAQRDHATITLLSVAPQVRTTFAAGYVPVASLQTEVDEEVQDILRAAAAAVPDDVSVNEVFRRGRAGPEIVAQIREGDYDAALLGSRGLGRMAGLVGSVSQHVLHHADIAVLVAHAPPSEDSQEPPGSAQERSREETEGEGSWDVSTIRR